MRLSPRRLVGLAGTNAALLMFDYLVARLIGACVGRADAPRSRSPSSVGLLLCTASGHANFVSCTKSKSYVLCDERVNRSCPIEARCWPPPSVAFWERLLLPTTGSTNKNGPRQSRPSARTTIVLAGLKGLFAANDLWSAAVTER